MGELSLTAYPWWRSSLCAPYQPRHLFRIQLPSAPGISLHNSKQYDGKSLWPYCRHAYHAHYRSCLCCRYGFAAATASGDGADEDRYGCGVAFAVAQKGGSEGRGSKKPCVKFSTVMKNISSCFLRIKCPSLLMDDCKSPELTVHIKCWLAVKPNTAFVLDFGLLFPNSTLRHPGNNRVNYSMEIPWLIWKMLGVF